MNGMKKIYYRCRIIKHKLKSEYKIVRRFVKYASKRIELYPEVIQLPITHLCNFDCVMCGMHHMINRKDFSAEELGTILSDKLFQYVKTIGVNGGEPFIKDDFVECILVMMEKLPYLSTINIITNGFFTDKILGKLSELRKITRDKLTINVSFSLDGINDMQDFHRGHKDAFSQLRKTIESILVNKDEYLDDFNFICTITKYNIYRINEVEMWARDKGVDVAYNIATVNERIENEEKLSDFSIFSDEHARMLAEEFFYCKYRECQSERYFGIYLFIKYKKRFSGCPCMYNQWVTLTPDSQIGFCATHSKKIGSALEKSALVLVKNNLDHLYEIRNSFCNSCSHYIYDLNSQGLRYMFEEQRKNWYLR